MEATNIKRVRRWRKQCEERAELKKITEKAKNPQWVVTPVKEVVD
jgi:pantothenate kinase-related protein Tda10